MCNAPCIKDIYPYLVLFNIPFVDVSCHLLHLKGKQNFYLYMVQALNMQYTNKVRSKEIHSTQCKEEQFYF